MLGDGGGSQERERRQFTALYNRKLWRLPTGALILFGGMVFCFSAREQGPLTAHVILCRVDARCAYPEAWVPFPLLFLPYVARY